MKLPHLGVHRPVTTLAIFAAIILLSVIALNKLQTDMLPEMDPPAVSVISVYPGASTEDVETLVTKVIEDQMSTIADVKHINSISKENISVVTIEFEWGTDLDAASNDIRDHLEFAKIDLPDDVEKPMIFKFNTSSMPILFLGLMADSSWQDLRHIADKKIADRLKRIPGVGAVILRGGLERQINVYFDHSKLESYGIPIEQVAGLIAANNITIPAGSLKTGAVDFTIRVPGEFENIEQIQNLVVGQQVGGLVYLKDIARVEDSYKEVKESVIFNKKTAMMVMIQKQSGANTVEVIDRVKAEMKNITSTLPPDIEYDYIMDSSENIHNSINSLSSTVLWGGLFVILITFFFLRELRGSLIIGLAIPFSLVIAFTAMYFAGYTINIMSLSSLAIAIGMVVDNAVVALDNIHRHLEDGERPRDAALFGTMEMSAPLTASTFTNIAVFVPLVFVGGIAGIMFKQLAFVVVVTILASLFVALLFVPMISSRIFRRRRRNHRGRGIMFAIYNISERVFLALERGYRWIITWALRHRVIVIVLFILVFTGSIFLVKKIGTSFIPKQDTGEIRITVELPVGTRLEESQKIADQIMDIFYEEVPEKRYIYSIAGESEQGIEEVFGAKTGSNIISVGAKLVPVTERKRSHVEVARALQEKINKIPGIAKLKVDTSGMMSMLFMGGDMPITVGIRGYDMEVTNKLADQIMEIMESTPGTTGVLVSRDPGKPELVVHIDRLKASTYGLNVAQIASTLRTSFNGTDVSQFRDSGDEFDIRLRLGKDFRRNIEDIKNVTIASPLGIAVKLKDIADVRRELGPVRINRKDQERIVTVGTDSYGRSMGEVTADIQKAMESLDVPSDIDVAFTGQVEEQKSSFKDMGMMLIIGIILVYLVMAAQFESFRGPFIVMFAIPFTFSGAFLFLFLLHEDLNLMSFLALIMLMGVVVNNAIVLVDYINLLRKRDVPFFEAIAEAGAKRLRPVLMTTMTTIFGVLPMIILRGEGSEMWRPLGVTIFGGLLVSTMVTLILVPVIYSVFERKMKFHIGRKGNGEHGKEAQPS